VTIPLAGLCLLFGLLQAPSDLQDPGQLWVAGRTDAAIARAREFVARHPEERETRELLIGWQVLLQQYQAALDDLGPAGGVVDRAWRGRILIGLGRYEEALAHLSVDDPEQAVARVQCLYALGRPDDAGDALEAAAGLLGADDAALAFWRGRLLAARAEHSAAIPHFRAALAREPLHMGALFGLGQSLLRTGARDEGRAVLERHRELVPLVDRYDFAVQSLSLAPTHGPNLAQVAGIEAELGLLDAARDRFQLACRMTTAEDAAPIALRAARFHEEVRRDPAAAVDLLASVGERFPDPRIWVRAADIAARAEQLREARSFLVRARDLRPADESILERLRQVDERLAEEQP